MYCSSTKGLDVQRDRRKFLAGSRIRDEIIRVMSECHVILIFHSIRSAEKPWTTFEREVAFDLEMDAKRKGIRPPRIIYVLLDDVELPSITERHRIAIAAKGRQPDDVCAEIFQHALEIPSLGRSGALAANTSLTRQASSSEIDDRTARRQYASLRAKIALYMKGLRQRMPQPAADPTVPKGFEAWPDNFNGLEAKRFIVYLRSSGCRWAIRVANGRSSMLPGCLDCEHSLAGSTFGRRVESHQYVQQFERAIAGVEFATHPVLCVYNEGNFFNTDELPATARRQILRRIDRIPDVKAVIVESLPRYLTKGVLAEMRKILGPRVIEIGIGLESADAVIRTLCVNKSYTLNDFVAAVARVRPYAQALAYVLLKPAFLTRKGST